MLPRLPRPAFPRARLLRAGLPLVLLLLGAGRCQEGPTIWLAGDSTMAPKLPEHRPQTGWGEMLGRFVRDGTWRVANHAMNGRSTRTFIDEGRWRVLVDSLRAGDVVVIQFGHNDESVEKIDRYTPPADFQRNLTRMVADVRARGASPVLFTPVYRRRFDKAGVLVDTHGAYPGLVRAVAAAEHVPLVDMHRSSGELLSAMGPDSSAALFLQLAPGASPNYPAGVQDNTHFNPRGALAMARLAAAGLRATGLPVAAHLLPPEAAVDTGTGAARGP